MKTVERNARPPYLDNNNNLAGSAPKININSAPAYGSELVHLAESCRSWIDQPGNPSPEVATAVKKIGSIHGRNAGARTGI